MLSIVAGGLQSVSNTMIIEIIFYNVKENEPVILNEVKRNEESYHPVISIFRTLKMDFLSE
jgi:hypothetical protein